MTVGGWLRIAQHYPKHSIDSYMQEFLKVGGPGEGAGAHDQST
jgi:hypothetical protein